MHASFYFSDFYKSKYLNKNRAELHSNEHLNIKCLSQTLKKFKQRNIHIRRDGENI